MSKLVVGTVSGLLSGVAVCVVAMSLAAPAAARGAFEPTYHPKPCSGDACQADDPRSNADCQGLLCTFSSAKAMRPPVTAAQAAEAERVRAAAAVQAAPAPSPAANPAPAKKRAHVVRAKASPPRRSAPPVAATDPKGREPVAAR